jgi:hypothetical protein
MLGKHWTPDLVLALNQTVRIYWQYYFPFDLLTQRFSQVVMPVFKPRDWTKTMRVFQCGTKAGSNLSQCIKRVYHEISFGFESKWNQNYASRHCCGSVTFWCGSGYPVPYLRLMDPDPDPTPDQTPLFNDFKDFEKIIFSYFFLMIYK